MRPVSRTPLFNRFWCYVGLKGTEDIAGTEVDPVGMFHGVFMNGIVIEFRQMITGSENASRSS